jgi:hypothetical protein
VENEQINSNNQDENIDIERFLLDSYRLFAITSFFVAVVGFFVRYERSQSGQTIIRIGAASSLLLAVFLIYLINRRAYDEVGGIDGVFSLVLNPNKSSLEFLLFFILVDILFISITGIGKPFSIHISFLIQVLSLIGGFVSATWVTQNWEWISAIGEDIEELPNQWQIFVTSIFSMLIGVFGLMVFYILSKSLNISAGQIPNNALKLSTQNVIRFIGSSYSLGVLSASVLYITLSVLIFLGFVWISVSLVKSKIFILVKSQLGDGADTSESAESTTSKDENQKISSGNTEKDISNIRY